MISVDGWKHRLSKVKDRIEKADLMNEFSWKARYENPELSALYANKALETADWEKYRRGKAYAWLNLAYGHFLKSENQKALEYLTKCLRFFEKEEGEQGLPIALYLMGNIHESFGDYEASLEMCQRALKLARKNELKEIEGEVLSVLGLVYSRLSDFDRAIQYYQESLDIRAEEGDHKAMASSLNRIARIHALKKEYETALDHYQQSLKIRQEQGHISAIPWTYLGMASTYEEMGDYTRAIEYYSKNLEAGCGDIDQRCRLQCLIGKGRCCFNNKDFGKAQSLLEEAIKLAEELDARPLLYEAHLAVARLFEAQENASSALFHYKRFQEIREEVHNAETRNRMKNQQIAFAVEKAEQEKEIFQLRNVELKAAFDEIAMKNQAITDSINYAKRIQNALLPQRSEMRGYMPDHFILFLPRDIVSGDFYWASKVEGKIVFTAADCTGHGVPGAFMSMLGLAFLDEIVNKQKVLQADRILDLLRREIVAALKQTGAEEDTKDGMDMGLCVYDPAKNEIQFSGAYNPMYLLRSNEIIEYRADRMPIGYYSKEGQAFTNHLIKLQAGDTIYLFSDGYADQFGGDRGKKLKYKVFQEYLLEVRSSPMADQHKTLERRFYEWMGDYEQIDDVVIMGVRF